MRKKYLQICQENYKFNRSKLMASFCIYIDYHSVNTLLVFDKKFTSVKLIWYFVLDMK